MNYEANLKTALSDARSCTSTAPVEQITSKCRGILEMAVIIEDTAENIGGKLFSPRSPCDDKRQEPYSIEDTLNCIRSVLNSATKTLQEINERT